MLKWTMQHKLNLSNHLNQIEIDIDHNNFESNIINMSSHDQIIESAVETIFKRKRCKNRKKDYQIDFDENNKENDRFGRLGTNSCKFFELPNSQLPSSNSIIKQQQQQNKQTLPTYNLEYSPDQWLPIISNKSELSNNIFIKTNDTNIENVKLNKISSPRFCQNRKINKKNDSQSKLDQFNKIQNLNSNQSDPFQMENQQFKENLTDISSSSAKSSSFRKLEDESLSSSNVGNTTLDQMLDAIIESAKKDLNPKRKINNKNNNFTKLENISFEDSIHEMEVRSPMHLKRQKGVRRKCTSAIKKPKAKRPKISLNEISSPKTPIRNVTKKENFDLLAKLQTPQSGIINTDSNNSPNYIKCPTILAENTLKRSLTYSDDEDSVEEYFSTEGQRDSVASTASSTTSSGRQLFIRGSLDLEIFVHSSKLQVHVIRCRNLQRPNGSCKVNAYVKCTIYPNNNEEDGFQRTSVHRMSSRPYFNHIFSFSLSDVTEHLMEENIQKPQMKFLQLLVWHRDRDLNRSEFLGCTSFPLKQILEANCINGSYKLQSQSYLTNPVQLNRINATPLKTYYPTNSTNLSHVIPNEMAEIKPGPVTRTSSVAKQKSNDEECMSIDSASALAGHSAEIQSGQPISFSKKAIHQRDADENLFLRFLELDPPWDGSSPAPPGTPLPQSANSSVRRQSTYKPQAGRTPFTITKRLARTAEKGFGFSIVWTHPPRVEKVEPSLSAAQNNIQPGDYVIFVDKHNVVTMPEADVLNLIRSQGNTLTLEIFRRQSNAPSTSTLNMANIGSNRPGSSAGVLTNGFNKTRLTSAASNYTDQSMSPAPLRHPVSLGLATSIGASSNPSLEMTKRKMQLPQVTFSKEIEEKRKQLLLNQQRKTGDDLKSIGPITDLRKRILLQLISREQNFVTAIQFGMQRFIQPLLERKDLVSPNDHKTLFQNIDELMRISEDILEQLVNSETEEHPQLNFVSRVYLSKTTAICAAYKKYCNGIKRADCVLVNKSRQPGSEFVNFITEPQVPRRRPDLTMLIHRPLQHFREILKLMQLLASHCHVDSEEHKNFTSVINELQSAYREITVGGGLMEPLGEGRPLLTLQDLEARMVFTRCKPFTLAVQGRQWIFGGDLSRVEGRSIKPYWTLLFSDIIVFAKVSRDRVLFITEEPLPIANIVDSCFNIRKKNAEFRLTVDPNGRLVESPTAYCAPDLTRTPKKSTRRKSLILRAPSMELKAVWQNLLQRQIFLVNAALGSTPLSSPLDSPDVLNTLVPLSDIGATTTSMASVKLASMDSLSQKLQQHRNINPAQQVENIIDQKCRILNKTGTPKGSALHLASWMKGQFDKQQEQARLAAIEHQASNHALDSDEIILTSEEEDDERITFWTKEQLEKRTKELKLSKEIKDNGRLSGTDEIGISDIESELKSPSRSTTSDSQITVRSSPNANLLDKISVCRHCHKNCKQSPTLSQKLPHSESSPSPPLLSNSLKVQHSQSLSNRCCQLTNGTLDQSNLDNARGSSVSSASSTITGELSDDISSNVRKKEPPAKPLRSPRPVAPTSISFSNSATTNYNNTATSITTSTNFNNSSIISTTGILNGEPSTEENFGDKNISAQIISIKKSLPSFELSELNKVKTTINSSSRSTCEKFIKDSNKKYIPCNCKCTPEDFHNTTLSPDEITQETCKLIEDVTKISKSNSTSKMDVIDDVHKNCKCVCTPRNFDENDDDLSLILIGLAQLNPASKLINTDSFVPTISIVPPTPEQVLSKTSVNIWDNQNRAIRFDSPGHAIIENIIETPDDSPLEEEPPYRPMNSSLKRYGTLSSLEKLPLEDDSVLNGDDVETEKGSSNEGDYNDDNDIEVITREIFDENNQTSLRNWTARAGSYVAGKMSFIDKYLGRWSQEHDNEEEQMEECTSGATSGEEVWGTPTSGGDNDDMQANSDLTQSSPTKSSGSLLDDDDTELMMDELLMAPPMTASTIRGLLPRRRLEPLFEEETESDEERTQQESEELKKGETSANGNHLEDSTGTSSDEEEPQIVGTAIMPIIESTASQLKRDDHRQTPPYAIQMQIKQMQIQKRHFLMMKNAGLIPKSYPIRETAITTTTAAPAAQQQQQQQQPQQPQQQPQQVQQQQWQENEMYAENMMTISNENTIPQSHMKVLKTSVISTTTNNEKNITFTEEQTQVQESSSQSQTDQMKTPLKKIIKNSPPPPPPRRFCSNSPCNSPQQKKIILNSHQLERAEKSGNTADDGFSVDVHHQKHHIHFIKGDQNVQINPPVASSTKDSAINISHVQSRQTVEQSITMTQKLNSSITTSKESKTENNKPEHQVEAEIFLTMPLKSQIKCEEKSSPSAPAGLSPRLEMRLALNHDILGDEDLISYNPGPDLTAILGHDLSTFHRLTGRDLLHRSATNRIQPKEAVISFCQQRNSKMDTPTVNRKQSQASRSTWSSSVFADPVGKRDRSVVRLRKSSNSSDESKLNNLELLAKQEMKFCMSQSRSGSPARVAKSESMKTMTNISPMTASATKRKDSSPTIQDNRITYDRKFDSQGIIGQDETASMTSEKGNRLYNYLLRRNSENQLKKELSQISLSESNSCSTPDRKVSTTSPRKDNDKPSLNRRFWKQLTRRRRANSVTEISELSAS